MDIREAVKNTLSESNLTNPSKLYTPFTLFAVYFAIYFKADILGRLFLSDDWTVTEKALADLKNPGMIEWFTFAAEVALYSLGMLLLYGAAQVIAVSIWATSNRINTALSAKLERGKHVSSALLHKAETRIEELRADNRALYTQLASYHQWKPEDITRLEDELAGKNESLKNTLKKLKSAEEEIENLKLASSSLSNDLRTVSSNLDTTTDERNNFELSSRTIFELYNYNYSIKSFRNTITTDEIASLFDEKDIIDHLIGIISGNHRKIIKFNSNEPDLGYAIGLLTSTTEMIEKVSLRDDGICVAIVNKSDDTIDAFLHLLPEYISKKLVFHAF